MEKTKEILMLMKPEITKRGQLLLFNLLLKEIPVIYRHVKVSICSIQEDF